MSTQQDRPARYQPQEADRREDRDLRSDRSTDRSPDQGSGDASADERRQVRQEEERLRHQGSPATPEERLAAGWADPQDPTQSMFEDTINEDEENLADKRT